MDEQVHSCTKWVDSIVGESYANSIRDGFYLGALVHLVNVIAGVSFNQNLFVHMLPLTFTAAVLTFFIWAWQAVIVSNVAAAIKLNNFIVIFFKLKN